MPLQRVKRSVCHNLPAPATSIFGREQEVARLCQRVLEPETRLITLTGVGGCGKTRLVLAVANRVAGSFKDGAWFVELAPLSDQSLVPHAVASVLGVREQPHQSVLDGLVVHVARRHLLLVLDNCEHLVQACAELADSLIQRASGLRVIATSREPLRIGGEVTFRVGSLLFPNPDAPVSTHQLGRFPAIRLFVDRATTAHPNFALTSGNASVVAAITARLEGLPLAIELASAWVRVIGVDQILERLDNSMGLLVGGGRTAPTRHQTMAATMDWSYGLLSARERLVFERLSMFVGGCSLEAAEFVCAGDGVPEEEVLRCLTRLVDASLVQVDEQDGRVRYRLLEPVRQYSRGHLAESGRLAEIRRRHAGYFLRYADSWEKDANGGGPDRETAHNALERERDNLRAAMRWCVEQSEAEMGLRFGRAHWSYWGVRGAYTEGRAWSADLTEIPSAQNLALERALVRSIAATLGWRQGRFEESRAIDTEVLPVVRQANHAPAWLLPSVLLDLAIAEVNQGYYSEAEAHFDEARAASRVAGDQVNEAVALRGLGWAALLQEQYPKARALCEESLTVARGVGDRWAEAVALGPLGCAALRAGDHAAAKTLLEEGLRLRRQVGDRYGAAYCLEILGQLATAQDRDSNARITLRESLHIRHEIGDLPGMADTLESMAALACKSLPQRSVLLAGAASRVREAAGVVQSPMNRTLVDGWLIPLRQTVGWDTTMRWFEAGRAYPLDRSIELAFKLRAGPHPRGASAPNRLKRDVAALSPREQEVAALLGQRLSNRQIADQLVVTERTVAAHVEHILAKLAFASRHQVGAWVLEQTLPHE